MQAEPQSPRIQIFSWDHIVGLNSELSLSPLSPHDTHGPETGAIQLSGPSIYRWWGFAQETEA